VAVDRKHPDYLSLAPLQQKARDVIAGEEAVHAGRELYLPRPPGQDNADYDIYLARAGFLNGTRQTVKTFSGMIFRNDPIIDASDAMHLFLEDVTQSDQSFLAFAVQAVDEQLSVYRYGVLLEAEGQDADGNADGGLPFWKPYVTENIWYWEKRRVRGNFQFSLIVLSEMAEEKTGRFDSIQVHQLRVLSLDGDGETYQQEIYQFIREDGNGEKHWVLTDTIQPLVQNAPFESIPFFFFPDEDIHPPPLLDLVNKNLDHYRTIADLEQLAHNVAIPIRYFLGIEEDSLPHYQGPDVIWHSTSADSKVGVVEISGAGGDLLERRAQAKKEEMAQLGARILAPDKKAAEAEGTLIIRAAGENSQLAALANKNSMRFTRLLEMTRDWMGETGDISVTFNTDYFPIPIDSAEMIGLMQQVQANLMSWEMYFWNMQRGDRLPTDRTLEEERAAIEVGGPGLTPPAPPSPIAPFASAPPTLFAEADEEP
jgi:hypothetical protein